MRRQLYSCYGDEVGRLSEQDADLMMNGHTEEETRVVRLPRFIPLPLGTQLPPGILATANIGSEQLLLAIRLQWGLTSTEFLTCNLVRKRRTSPIRAVTVRGVTDPVSIRNTLGVVHCRLRHQAHPVSQAVPFPAASIRIQRPELHLGGARHLRIHHHHRNGIRVLYCPKCRHIRRSKNLN